VFNTNVYQTTTRQSILKDERDEMLMKLFQRYKYKDTATHTEKDTDTDTFAAAEARAD